VTKKVGFRPSFKDYGDIPGEHETFPVAKFGEEKVVKAKFGAKKAVVKKAKKK
jgi:hypothetical protein